MLNQDYVRTARAKGLRERVVVGKHALKNAMLPVITVIGLNFGLVISGAVLTETIFSLTGVGRTLVDSITSRDYTLVQGFTVVIAAGFVIINMVVDILYGYLDPAHSLQLDGLTKDRNQMANKVPATFSAYQIDYRSPNLWLEALRNLRHSPSALLGSAVIGALVIIAILRAGLRHARSHQDDDWRPR